MSKVCLRPAKGPKYTTPARLSWCPIATDFDDHSLNGSKVSADRWSNAILGDSCTMQAAKRRSVSAIMWSRLVSFAHRGNLCARLNQLSQAPTYSTHRRRSRSRIIIFHWQEDPGQTLSGQDPFAPVASKWRTYSGLQGQRKWKPWQRSDLFRALIPVLKDPLVAGPRR